MPLPKVEHLGYQPTPCSVANHLDLLATQHQDHFAMGIYDRDYMRRDDSADWWKPGYSVKRWLVIGILALSLLSSLVYFGRSIGPTKSPKRPVVTNGSTPVARFGKGSLRVNLNTATVEELQTLPGIGPARAKLITANRPYQSIDDLAKLQGVGAKLVNDLRPFIKADGDTEKFRGH